MSSDPWTDLIANEQRAMSDDAAGARANLLLKEAEGGALIKASVCGYYETSDGARCGPQWFVEIESRYHNGWWAFFRSRYGQGYGVRFGQAFENALAAFERLG